MPTQSNGCCSHQDCTASRDTHCLQPFVNSHELHGMQIPGIEDVLVEAVSALAAAPANVAVILDAAALEPLLEALSGPSPPRAAAAAHALGLLAREDDARLSTLSPAPLQVCAVSSGA